MTGIAERIWGVLLREDCSDAGAGIGEVMVSKRFSLGLRPGKRRMPGGPPEDMRRSCFGPCGSGAFAPWLSREEEAVEPS